MARNLQNFLRAYMEYTSDTEPSDQYHFWTAATIIATATKRQVYLDMNHFDIRPNMYTILVGPSGARKSTAANLGLKLALKIGLKKFSDKMTSAALIKSLSESTEKRIRGTEVNFCSPILLYSNELGVFFGVDAYKSGLLADLTDLYDGGDPQGNWSKETISRGKETIANPFVNMLIAGTPQTLKEVIPIAAASQGFPSRVMFIWASKRRKRISRSLRSGAQDMLEFNLVKDLESISKLSGQFKFSPEGWKLYDSTYMTRPEPEDEFDDERLRGYASRKDIHILKVAMILSLASNDSLLITEKEIKSAMDAIRWMESGLTNIFVGYGASTTSQDTVRVFQQIQALCKSKGFATDQEITKRNYAHLTSAELEGVIGTLRRALAIEESWATNPVTKQNERHYRIVDKSFIGTANKQMPTQIKNEED